MFDVANALGVDVKFFFDEYDNENGLIGLAEEKSEFEHEKNEVTNREIMSLVKAYSSIKSAETRKKAIDLIKSLANS